MSKPRVLIACEFSGAVRNQFANRGWDAWSCDLLASESPGKHYRGDVSDILHEFWDLMIAFPPCTHLCVSGARWFKEKRLEQKQALAFVRLLLSAPIPHIALENPVGVISSKIRKPDQIIQPWQFGHGETKSTCLWLKNLPLLIPTKIVAGRRGFTACHPDPTGRVNAAGHFRELPERWPNNGTTLAGFEPGRNNYDQIY
jgi:hypothetical protein